MVKLNLFITRRDRDTAARMERLMATGADEGSNEEEFFRLRGVARWTVVSRRASFAGSNKAQSWGRAYRDVELALIRHSTHGYDRRNYVAHDGRFTVHYGIDTVASPRTEFARKVAQLEGIALERNRVLDRRRERIFGPGK